MVLIEKKVAARYEVAEEPDSSFSQPSRYANEDNEPTEEDALLSKSATDEMYRMPSLPPRWIKNFPIAYIFKDVRLLVAMLLCLIQSSLLASFDATIPTYAKETWGFDSLNSGLLFIPLILPYLLLGPLCGWAVDRYGTKPVATIGYAYMVPALTLLRLPHTGGGSQIALYSSLLFFCGIGVCIIGSPSLVEASFVVEQYHKANLDFFGEQGPYAQLYALNSLVYSLGMTVGPLFSGILKDSIGYGNANLVLASICLVTSVLSFIYVGGTPKILTRKSGHGLDVTER
jgi:MFS family permease